MLRARSGRVSRRHEGVVFPLRKVRQSAIRVGAVVRWRPIPPGGLRPVQGATLARARSKSATRRRRRSHWVVTRGALTPAYRERCSRTGAEGAQIFNVTNLRSDRIVPAELLSAPFATTVPHFHDVARSSGTGALTLLSLPAR